MQTPILALTQGDPAGVGPEVIAKLLSRADSELSWLPLVVAELAAFESLPDGLGSPLLDRLHRVERPLHRETIEELPGGAIAIVDPVGEARRVELGVSGPADAAGALAALDTAVNLVESSMADAVVTAPVSKQSISKHVKSTFRGHTDYLAERAGLEGYGRDYLMAFLTPDLQVALLSTHLPLRQALDAIDEQSILLALRLLGRVVDGRIGVAGLNPHAGEGGLLGDEDETMIRPAVDAAIAEGVHAHGPLSADSIFARALRNEFDWILALYHDQGLIAVKTLAFGYATNWTLGLPYLRTSVDHGTAFDIAGQGIASERPLGQVVETTLGLISGDLPAKHAGD